MMGKVIKSGRSFGGCVLYCLQREAAAILLAEGVRTDEMEHIIADFNMQRKLNPDLGQAVGHISLNWSPQDVGIVTDWLMMDVAREYMEKMKLSDTQYLVVRHTDKAHPHVHIIYNRVGNNGKTISDSMQRWKNVKVSKALTLKHGLHISDGKEQVKRQQLKGSDKFKYVLYDAIKPLLATVSNFDDLKKELSKQGIDVLYKYKSGTTEVQGISFSKGGQVLKGSAIDRSLSFLHIDRQLQRNEQVRQYHLAVQSQKPLMAGKLREAIRQDIQFEHRNSPDMGKGILDALLKPEFVGAAPDPIGDAEIARKKRKKREAEQTHSQSPRMSR